jgi:hypothetical protein
MCCAHLAVLVILGMLSYNKTKNQRMINVSIASYIYNILYDNRPSIVSTTIRFMRTRSSKYDLALGPEIIDSIMNGMLLELIKLKRTPNCRSYEWLNYDKGGSCNRNKTQAEKSKDGTIRLPKSNEGISSWRKKLHSLAFLLRLELILSTATSRSWETKSPRNGRKNKESKWLTG